MSEIKYTADDRAFLPLKNSNDTKSTTVETQADLTHVSVISDSIVHVVVTEAFDALQKEHAEMRKSGNPNLTP
jgi:hypothetical protein